MRRGWELVFAAALVALGVGMIVFTALSSDGTSPARAGSKETIVVGVSGAFAENQIVAEMYAQVLEHAGYSVERQFDFPSREISQTALESGQIDLKPEYLSSLLLFLDANARASSDPGAVARQDGRLLREQGITMLTPSPAQDKNVFVANLPTAVRFHLATMSSLSLVAGQLQMGGSPECPQRPLCLLGLRDTYGITFDDFKPLDVGGPETVAALKDNTVQIGLLFSTDPNIRGNGFVPLVDDKHLQNAENITPVIRTDRVDHEVRSLLDAVSAQLTTQKVTELVGQVNDGKEVGAVAKHFLLANRLL